MTEHMNDHMELLRRRRFSDAREGDPYHCKGVGFEHHVRSDNPRPHGRCEQCRAFVVHTRKGWRKATMHEAALWGAFGRGRVSDRLRKVR